VAFTSKSFVHPIVAATFNNGGRYAYIFDSRLLGPFAKRRLGGEVGSERECYL